MRRGSRILCTLALWSFSAESLAQSTEIWFPTSAPELRESERPAGRGRALLSRAEYRRHLEISGRRGVSDPDPPTETAPLVGFGFNFVFAGENRGFAVYGTAEEGYSLYGDLDADGALDAGERLPLETRDDYWTALFETTEAEDVDGQVQRYPVSIRFVISRIGGPDGPLGWATYGTTIRRGTIHLGTRTVPFALFGSSGLYDEENQVVWFDFDGDGQGADDPASPERFRVVDQHVNIGGSSYAFRVDRFGRSLVLKTLESRLPDRPSLAAGSAAPAVSAIDIEGRPLTLEAFLGEVVLLDFWAAWCGPCRDEAPRLRALYEQYAAAGLVIIGISSDPADAMHPFVEDFGHTWPHVSEPFDGPIHVAYRVEAYPTRYLIGRDGTILRDDIDWTVFPAQVRAALSRR